MRVPDEAERLLAPESNSDLLIFDNAKNTKKIYVRDLLDTVQVGGRNLFLNTRHPDLTNPFWDYSLAASVYATIGEFTAMKVTGTWGRFWSDKITYAVNEVYTFSCYVKKDASLETGGETYVVPVMNSAEVLKVTLDGQVPELYVYNDFKLSTEFKKLVITFKIAPNDYVDNKVRFEPIIRDSNGTYIESGTPCMVVYGMKMERGNTATDWTPAPEDAEAAIAAVVGDWITGNVSGGSGGLSVKFQRIGTKTLLVRLYLPTGYFNGTYTVSNMPAVANTGKMVAQEGYLEILTFNDNTISGSAYSSSYAAEFDFILPLA
jgi:hypothetical protein